MVLPSKKTLGVGDRQLARGGWQSGVLLTIFQGTGQLTTANNYRGLNQECQGGETLLTELVEAGTSI